MTDTCPNCARTKVPPVAIRSRGRHVVHGYRCPFCQHQWATSRATDSYPNLEARDDVRLWSDL